jgi:hypothetical protein
VSLPWNPGTQFDDVMTAFLKHLRSYSQLGWKMFPCHTACTNLEDEYTSLICTCDDGLECRNIGKHPLYPIKPRE